MYCTIIDRNIHCGATIVHIGIVTACSHKRLEQCDSIATSHASAKKAGFGLDRPDIDYVAFLKVSQSITRRATCEPGLLDVQNTRISCAFGS